MAFLASSAASTYRKKNLFQTYIMTLSDQRRDFAGINKRWKKGVMCLRSTKNFFKKKRSATGVHCFWMPWILLEPTVIIPGRIRWRRRAWVGVPRCVGSLAPFTLYIKKKRNGASRDSCSTKEGDMVSTIASRAKKWSLPSKQNQAHSIPKKFQIRHSGACLLCNSLQAISTGPQIFDKFATFRK